MSSRFLFAPTTNSNKETSPHYESLSYRWGTEESPSHVQIKSDGHYSGVIPVRRSLDVSLRHLRDPLRSRYLWIDALCINQTDLSEKIVQVATMNKRFATANRVVSWLGPREGHSNQAFALLPGITRNIEVDWDTLNMQTSLNNCKRLVKEPLERMEQLVEVSGYDFGN